MKTKLQSDGTSCPAALLRLGVPSQRLTGNDLIVFTIPEKPRSRLKKYGITESGRKVLKNTGSVWRN